MEHKAEHESLVACAGARESCCDSKERYFCFDYTNLLCFLGKEFL